MAIAGPGGLIARARSGDWLDRQRVRGYACIALTIEIIGILVIMAGTHGWIVKLDHPATTDFVSFYAAGTLVDAGTPRLVYDQAAHHAAEERATAPGIDYVYFYYPPVFLLICALLATLPYLVAYVVFQAVTLAAFLWVGRATLRDGAAILPLLAFPAGLWNLGIGQNAFLTATLFGAAILWVDRRPLIAGLLIGALCYKPHLGLLIPVALIAGGHWRAFGAAAASLAACIAVSVLCVGVATWHDFLVAALGAHHTYDSGGIDFGMLVSPYGGVLLVGGGTALAYAVQAVATVSAMSLVALVWHRRLSLPLRGATLAAATLIAVPVVLTYDLMLAAVATLWLVRDGRENGFPPWQQSILAGLFLIPLIERGLGHAWHLPVGPLGTIALVILVAARALREPTRRADAVPFGRSIA